jgi:hypothetical protein
MQVEFAAAAGFERFESSGSVACGGMNCAAHGNLATAIFKSGSERYRCSHRRGVPGASEIG